jgi:hypothetical protein
MLQIPNKVPFVLLSLHTDFLSLISKNTSRTGCDKEKRPSRGDAGEIDVDYVAFLLCLEALYYVTEALIGNTDMYDSEK